MIWSFVRFLLPQRHQAELHSGFNGVRCHENSVFLYKSHQAEWASKHRYLDYFAAGCIGGYLAGVSPFLFIPSFFLMVRYPRVLANAYYFTVHAELLPHTEQVVFTKVKFFGGYERHFVPISALEKIDDPSELNGIFWQVAMHDE